MTCCTTNSIICWPCLFSVVPAGKCLAACRCCSVEPQCCMDRQGATCTVEDMVFDLDMLAPLNLTGVWHRLGRGHAVW